MVEIFKTNVLNKKSAKTLLIELTIHLPNSYINFDLEDCDNILRIENCSININLVVRVLNENGYNCELLQ